MDRILEAAAAEFAEVGFETTTTNKIAARAGVPIGSLYQFFGDKHAILDALTDRYVQELARIAQQGPSSPEAASLDDVLVPIIEGLVMYSSRNPDFLMVFAAPPASSGPGLAGIRIRHVMRANTEKLLAHKNLPESRLPIVAEICTELLRGILPMAVSPDVQSAELVKHLRAAIGGYLTTIEAQT